MSKFSKSWRKRRETEHRVRVQREVEVLRETPMLQRATILFPVLRGGPLRWSNIGMLGATALIIENSTWTLMTGIEEIIRAFLFQFRSRRGLFGALVK
ncbi:uncharacterized protein LOC143260499 isoform X2 [Megalopta genalis]|uniref:uncharacterized protein LOC143260499 isoform X2 n=1 Tax=Megalopta genalis TaxID=115081 RepID=UPI003FD6A25C